MLICPHGLGPFLTSAIADRRPDALTTAGVPISGDCTAPSTNHSHDGPVPDLQPPARFHISSSHHSLAIETVQQTKIHDVNFDADAQPKSRLRRPRPRAGACSAASDQ